jgi:hypothetical protein
MSSYHKIPQSFVKRKLREKSLRDCNQLWIISTKGQTTREFFATVYARIKLNDLKLDSIRAQKVSLLNHNMKKRFQCLYTLSFSKNASHPRFYRTT